MKTFEKDPTLKQKIHDQLLAHYKADEIVKGKYWENGKGCAIGCTIHSDDHGLYPELFGIPEWLAKLEDRLFEGMPNKTAKKFPLRFWNAIPEGVDLDPLKYKFIAFLMRENIDRVLNLKHLPKPLKTSVVTAIRKVLTVNENSFSSGKRDRSAWAAVRSAKLAAELAAWSAESEAEETAAESAARAAESAARAAEAAAESAARAAESAAWAAESAARAAESAARAAESAAWAAESAARAAAAAAWAAESAKPVAYERYADELIRLLGEAK